MKDSKKKVRGIKRKTRNMIKNIEHHTMDFPKDFHNGFWHTYLPVAQSFIEANRLPQKVKEQCITTLLDRAKHLKETKPDDNEKYRVVVFIKPYHLWDAQITIFKGDDSTFNNFYNINDEIRTWTPITEQNNKQKEWGIEISNDWSLKGFKVVVEDDVNDYYFDGEIWLVGEIN